MLEGNRADFGLYNSSIIDKADTLLPDSLGIVEGLTIGMNSSRHFMVSKIHPDGEKIFHAIEKGIIILHQKGTIQKALRESGVLNKKALGWKKIYPNSQPDMQ